MGCNRCSLKVAQRGAGGKVNILDQAEFPVNFGSRIFADEAVSAQSVSELCRIIEEYLSIAAQSAPEKVDIFISAALRRAINSIYIYERIRDAVKPYTVHLMSDEDELVGFIEGMMLTVPEIVDTQRRQLPAGLSEGRDRLLYHENTAGLPETDCNDGEYYGTIGKLRKTPNRNRNELYPSGQNAPAQGKDPSYLFQFDGF